MNITDPNIYEYIANFADDRTILSMLSVNKKFRDEKLFQRIIQRRYPLLIEFKQRNETWQHFFVQMTYYIHKLEEDYDIPYIPTKGYNPRVLFGKEDIYDEAMYYAAEGGSLDLVKFFIDKGANNWDFGMYGAAQGGSLDLVKFFIDKGTKDWNGGMYYAVRGGHKDLVDFFKQKLGQ